VFAVQIGSFNTCELYSDLHDETNPRWGLTGEGDKEFTHHIMCCLQNEDVSIPSKGSSKITDDEIVESDLFHRPPGLEDDEKNEEKVGFGAISSENNQSTKQENDQSTTYQGATNTQSIQQNQQSQKDPLSQMSPGDLQELLIFFEPVWFDRSYRWEGSDLSAAQEFCSNKAGQRSLCPYIAYCPEGPMGTIQNGHTSDRSIEWAPMQEWNGLNWVGIGKDNSCLQARDESEFGLEESKVGDGSGIIMCCKDKLPELDGD